MERVKVINVFAWVRSEEIFLVNQAECQTFETLKQHFYVFFTHNSVFTILNSIPIENILSVPDLIWLHLFAINPYAIFYKMHTQSIRLSQLNWKPDIGSGVNLIHEFEEWALF